jgi:hypothetical protein
MPISASVPEPKRFFLDRFALDERVLEDTLGTAIARKADFADLYFEFRISEGFALEEGIVKKAVKNISQGAGVRVVAGDKTGCAHTDDVTVDALRLASKTAQTIADAGGTRQAVAVQATRATHNLYALPHSPSRPASRTKWRCSTRSTSPRGATIRASPTCSRASASSRRSFWW